MPPVIIYLVTIILDFIYIIVSFFDVIQIY
jgi:hypothetical protein